MKKYTLEELINRILKNNQKIEKEIILINVDIEYFIPFLNIFNKKNYINFKMFLHNIFKDEVLMTNKEEKKYSIQFHKFLTKKNNKKKDYYVINLSKIKFYK